MKSLSVLRFLKISSLQSEVKYLSIRMQKCIIKFPPKNGKLPRQIWNFNSTNLEKCIKGKIYFYSYTFIWIIVSHELRKNSNHPLGSWISFWNWYWLKSHSFCLCSSPCPLTHTNTLNTSQYPYSLHARFPLIKFGGQIGGLTRETHLIEPYLHGGGVRSQGEGDVRVK